MGKEYNKAVYCHLVYITSMQSISYEMISWMNQKQAGIKIAGRNINSLRYADNTTLMAGSEGELENLLMKVKEDSEKAGLKLSIQKTKIMASGLIMHAQLVQSCQRASLSMGFSRQEYCSGSSRGSS